MCDGQAHVYEEEGRYRIYCITCGYADYLKIAARKEKSYAEAEIHLG